MIQNSHNKNESNFKIATINEEATEYRKEDKLQIEHHLLLPMHEKASTVGTYVDREGSNTLTFDDTTIAEELP